MLIYRDYRNGDSRENDHSSRYDREIIVMKELGSASNNVIPLKSVRCKYDGSFMQLGGGKLLSLIIKDNKNMIMKEGAYSTDSFLSKIIIGMSNGVSTLHSNGAVHTDIDVKQWVVINSTAYLQDFNRVRFLDTLKISNQDITCKVYIKKAGGSRRSPEEYNLLWLDYKLDVWSLGMAIYEVMYGEEIWKTINNSRKTESNDYVAKGEYSKIEELSHVKISLKNGRSEDWSKDVLEGEKLFQERTRQPKNTRAYRI